MGTPFYFAGFEDGDGFELYATSSADGGSISVGTTAHSGAYGLNVTCPSGGTALGHVRKTLFTSTGRYDSTFGLDTIYGSLYFRASTLPNSGETQIFVMKSTSYNTLGFTVDASGVLRAYNFNDDTLLATGTIDLVAGRWYRLDFKQDGVTDYELKVDGVVALSGADAEFASGGFLASALRLGVYSSGASAAVSFWYDDVVLCADSYFDSPHRVIAFLPDAEGTHTAWSGTFTEVDERPISTDHVQPTAVDQKESYFCQDLAELTGTLAIVSVKSHLVMKRDSVASSVKVLIRSADNEVQVSLDATVMIPYNGYSMMFNTIPVSGDPWTVAAVNAFQIGVENTSYADPYGALWGTGQIHVLLTGDPPGGGRIFPSVFLLSDYHASDVGSAGGYDDSMRLFFADLDFGIPNYDKILERVELVYESLKEVPITIKAWRRRPLTDTGTEADETSVTTAASQSEESGVFWSETSPVWDTARYAPLRRFTARVEPDMIRGRGFDLGIIVQCDLVPFRLVKIACNFHVVPLGTRGEIVSA